MTRAPDPFAKRLEKYMADVLDMHEPWTDQEQNFWSRHLAQFAHRERRLMRKEQAPALNRIRFSSDAHDDDIADIDRATKARR